MSVEFTPREVSELSGTPRWTIEKAIEQNVLVPGHAEHGRRKRQRLLPLYAVAYVRVVGGIDLRIPMRMKRRLVSRLSKLKPHEFSQARVELAPAVELDLGRLVGDAIVRAQAYGAARDAMIEEDEVTPGAEARIRGAGVSVYVLAERATGTADLADLRAEYPNLPDGALEAALIYVRAHPPLGRRPRPA